MRDKNETTKRLMDVALDLFSQQGYYGTTTNEIANAAGLNELTLFRHFGSKLNLFKAIMDYYATDPEMGDVFEGVADTDFEESIVAIARRIYQLYEKNESLYKIQLKLTDNATDFEKLKLSREFIAILEPHFKQLIEAGILEGNPHIMAVTLINSLLGAFTVRLLGEGITEASTEALIEAHAKQFASLYMKQ